MQSDEEQPKPEQPKDSKTTAPPETPRGLTPREAALMWGVGSPGWPGDGVRRRYAYSKT